MFIRGWVNFIKAQDNSGLVKGLFRVGLEFFQG